MSQFNVPMSQIECLDVYGWLAWLSLMFPCHK